MNSLRRIGVALLLPLIGCQFFDKHPPVHVVVLVDESASIEPKAREDMFKCVLEIAGRLRRGDRLTVIPIVNDAEADSQGRILRYPLPLERQPYDEDLRQLRSRVEVDLRAERAKADRHPGSKTDLLGAIELGRQEFHLHGSERRVLIVLSDLIQDDGILVLGKDPALRSVSESRSLGRRLAGRLKTGLVGTNVYLGRMQSKDFRALGHERRAAMCAFWQSYFEVLQAKVVFVNDGPDTANVADLYD